MVGREINLHRPYFLDPLNIVQAQPSNPALRRIIQRLILVPEPDQLVLAVTLTDVNAELLKGDRPHSDTVCKRYDEATVYRDGKWIMFEPTDTSEFDDYMKLLAIKRKPNRK